MDNKVAEDLAGWTEVIQKHGREHDAKVAEFRRSLRKPDTTFEEDEELFGVWHEDHGCWVGRVMNGGYHPDYIQFISNSRVRAFIEAFGQDPIAMFKV